MQQDNYVEHFYSIGNHATARHVDFVCQSGLFDTIWLDMEHFDIRINELAIFNMIARAYPVTLLARISARDYQIVMQVLETGIGGIICAMVNSGATAEQIVQWARFNNPLPQKDETIGMRGYNAGNADAEYGSVAAADYIARQNQETAILCQIETEEAVNNIEEIVAVRGITGLFFGPGDFAHNIGQVGQIMHPNVLEAMEHVSKTCQRHGKIWGTLGVGREMYDKVRSLGARFISPGGDLKVMHLGLKALARTFEDSQST